MSQEIQEDEERLSDEEYFKRLVEYRNSGINRFASYINIEITEIGLGWAQGEITLKEYHGNPIGSVHGGCLFSLADSVGGAAAVSRRRAVTTINSSINYMSAAMNTKKIYATAKELKAGRQTCVYDVIITDDNKRPLVHATMTYFYLKGEFKLPAAD